MFSNAWGGAARIWDALFNKYLKDPKNPYDTWIIRSGADAPIWKLATRSDLSPCERATHIFTFDHFYVLRKHFLRLALDLRSFNEKYPAIGGARNHLPEWANFIETSDADAIGLWATSVCSNPWKKYDEATDTSTPFPLSEGWEVYDWMDENIRHGDKMPN